MDINYNSLYLPLLPRSCGVEGAGVPDSVRYIVIEGGRGSAKSFHTSTALSMHTFVDGCNILFSRYTMTSAEVSIIPEFKEKLQMLNREPFFNIKRAEIENVTTGGQILFRGIQQGSKSQTARLKSIPNLKIFVLDEAEELMDERTFDTIDFSLRKKGIHCQIWIVLNPSDMSHWIYRRFHAQAGVPVGFNGIKGDTCYIHTTYLDNLDNLDDAFVAQAERVRMQSEDKYNNIFLGQWHIQKDGLIYKGWERIEEDDYPVGLPQWWAADWGYSDYPNASVRMCYDPASGTLYLKQLPTLGKLTRDAARAIIEDARSIGYEPCDCEVYCDPARPENIAEMRQIYDLSAMRGINKDKTGRIHYLQGFRVRYIGETIGEEVKTYSWKPDPHNESLYTDTPQDGNDHYMDCISYGATRLRAMGVNGEV